MKSVHDLTSTMKTVGNGCLAQRAREGDDVPAELNEIACHFNAMIDKLQESIESEKTAHIRQMKAEIMALETQLNPHFLYNTLDTINWVAIGKKDYEVSNSITCLANILRYGINQSNSEVELHEEIEWLKQYLYLQQMRLKSGFDCEIDVDDNANYVKIHKLLFQPFIENSIVHGLNKKDGINRLKIRIHLLREVLHIIIWEDRKSVV